MPSGPEVQAVYTAHQAYNVIGRRKYGYEWVERFTGRPANPDLTRSRRRAAAGEPIPPELQEYVDEEPEEAKRLQALSRREDEVVKDLVNAPNGTKRDAGLPSQLGDWFCPTSGGREPRCVHNSWTY